MTGQAMARLSGVTADVGPAPGSAWQPPRPGVPRPLEAGWFTLVTLPTSPFWARRYTRTFLHSCRGISEDTAQTAELLVSELVTNAVRFAGDPARTLRYSERASASLISLSLRHFREHLLIEVYDTDDTPPALSRPGDDAESGRGLMLVSALSKEWSYFLPPGGGKVVYCVLETHDPPPRCQPAHHRRARDRQAPAACEPRPDHPRLPRARADPGAHAGNRCRAGRTRRRPAAGGSQHHDSGMLPGPPPPLGPAGRDRGVHEPPARAGLDAERNQG